MISNTYSYSRLTGPGEIRLLLLCPGDVHDPICCFLFSADLNSKPDNNPEAGCQSMQHFPTSGVSKTTPPESILMVKHSMLRATYIPHCGDFERDMTHLFFGWTPYVLTSLTQLSGSFK